jgi:flagellar biosynthesis protein FlhG
MDQADSLRQMLGARKKTDPKLRVMAVTSGKGGVGKTNVSANLAVLAAQAGRRVLIIDADLGLALSAGEALLQQPGTTAEHQRRQR